MIHPYEQNDKCYNFFFHPLHQSNGRITDKPLAAWAIITNIALTILTGMIWQIVFWAVNQWDEKSVQVWKEHNTLKGLPAKTFNEPCAIKTEETATIGEGQDAYLLATNAPIEEECIQWKTESTGGLSPFQETFSKPCAIKIEDTGLIGHGQNTCFLATAIQLCRQLPEVRKALATTLEQKKEETNEQFQKRKNFHHCLQKILYKTEKRENISGAEMEDLHQIAHEYSSKGFSKPGDKSCAHRAFIQFFDALSLPLYNYIMDAKVRDEKYFKHVLIKIVDSKEQNFPFEYTYQVKQDLSKTVTYRLSGAASYAGGHARAYIKDLSFPSKDFILCDDLAWKHVKSEKIEKGTFMPAMQFLLVYIRE